MKKILLVILLAVFSISLFVSCGSKAPKPIVVINKRKVLRSRILAGEVYFAKIYTVSNGEKAWKIEHQDIMKEWSVGDTIGWNEEINAEY